MSYDALQFLIVALAVLGAALAATSRWWRPRLMKTTQPQAGGCSTGAGCGSGCGGCGAGGSSTIQVDDLMRELRQRR